jgi:acylphosphatase
MNGFTGVIFGHVQGVGFRYFAKNTAEGLRLTGWVRNLPDGNVEVMATGPLPALEQFMHCLKAGPLGSRVEKVDFQWLREPQEFKDFEIRG